MKISELIKTLFKLRDKINRLTMKEKNLTDRLNCYFDSKRESSVETNKLLAVKDLASISYIDKGKAEEYLNKSLISKITSIVWYSKIIIEKIESLSRKGG